MTIAMVLSMAFMSTGTAYISSAAAVPQNIRVGVQYNGNTKYPPAPMVQTGADKGVEAGFIKNGAFILLTATADAANLTIRKDSWFIKSGTSLKEYAPGAATIPAGERLGPYHVLVAQGLTDAKAAAEKAAAFTAKGIGADVYYKDGWCVTTGFFADEAAAKAFIGSDVTPKLGAGSYTVVPPSDKRLVVSTAAGQNILFESVDSYLKVRPSKANTTYMLKLNNKKYRGELEFRRFATSDITVINILTMEQYLYGVVPRELEPSAPAEALKAQAVAARTYAVTSTGKHKDLQFDICNTTHCQVYEGMDAEYPATNQAVDGTAGKIVTYDGKPASVFYFSSSGGWTEDVANVWGSSIPYLKSVEDKYESGKSWKYTWIATFTASTIKDKLTANKKDIGEVTGITVTQRSPVGRVTQIVIHGTKDTAIFQRDKCRSLFGYDIVGSQWYEITTDADVRVMEGQSATTAAQVGNLTVQTAAGTQKMPSTGQVTILGSDGKTRTVPVVPTQYTFTGKGYGHGVGMSQEGAKGMALAGFTYEQILQHYFQGTKVE